MFICVNLWFQTDFESAGVARVGMRHWRAFVIGLVLGFIPVSCVSLVVGQGFGGELGVDNVWAERTMLFAVVALPLVCGWLAARAAKRRIQSKLPPPPPGAGHDARE